MLYRVRRDRQLPVLVPRGEAAPGPLREVVCFALGRRARATFASFLRDHAGASLHVTLLGPAAPARVEIEQIVEIAGIEAAVEAENERDTRAMRRWIERWTPTRAVDLLVFAEIPALALLAGRFPAPALLLPPHAVPQTDAKAIDLPDVLDDGGPLRVRVDQVAAVGDLPAVADTRMAFVARGRVVVEVTTRAGQAELPAGIGVRSLGYGRSGEGADPLPAIEGRVAVLRPGVQPLVLFDAQIAEELLRAIGALAGPPPPDLLAVRMRPTRSCQAIRERLQAAGIAPHVIDARAVLDEGEALDISEALDGVRLVRVAERMRKAGYPVATIVHRSEIQPFAEGFRAIAEPELVGHVRPTEPPAVTQAASIAGNRIELELDNAQARRWLLDAIRRARSSVHLQVYIADDDAIGREVEAALAEAAARGVRVRMLVDSLHTLHGSFGRENPLLARLARRRGIELRTADPVTELPSLVDLKLRDHRKLVVVDDRLALVGGRNLAREYYAGFGETAVHPGSDWRDLPWLDAGVRMHGPAVAAVQTSFRDAWRAAGGKDLAIAVPPPAGSSAVRLVVHEGLRDARTLETYLALVDGARSHVYVVNGFPLVLELQHALLRAVRRGVRVRALVGHVLPTWSGKPFGGSWSTARTAATQLVHSRIDPIVAAGGEAWLFALRDVPGWAPDLGLVHPHVHAKLLSVDGERFTVGSANLDVTSAYWESELLLVVEDAAHARDLEARIDTLLEGSVRVDGDDPAWREAAGRRTWMRHWPGVLSV